MKGMYVPVTIGGTQLSFLVDTGATDTYISKSGYRKLQEKPTIQTTTEKVMLADGSQLEVDGKIHTEVIIGQGKARITLIVADICSDGVLGMDNLLQLGARLNLETATMEIKWGSVQCRHEDNTRTCFRIIATEMYTIPAGREGIITGKVLDGVSDDVTGMVEASNDRRQLTKKGIILVRTLVRTSNGAVPVRVYNPTGSQRVIKKETELGYLSAVSEPDIQASQLSSEDIILPEYLTDLYERSILEVPEQYHAPIAKLLTTYQDVFSKGDYDLGKTNLVKHTVDTGQTRPIKQRPRKHPFGQRDEIRKHVNDLLDRELIEPSDSPWAANIVLGRKMAPNASVLITGN
ncbi:uncharacterized protein LOC135153474 [Lytechinus pictus]|uniref:uncharacterized protein LOC135153474 n=1 Tax=Lytechinus pictus TaxID=7653 RepID=UPI0030BA1775